MKKFYRLYTHDGSDLKAAGFLATFTATRTTLVLVQDGGERTASIWKCSEYDINGELADCAEDVVPTARELRNSDR